MIDEYAQFKNGKLTVEVNWNPSVSPCEFIKFIVDGKIAIVDRAYLYQMMMLFGNEDQQEQLIPVTETTVKPVKRLLKVKAKQDIKKGELISVVHTVYVPMLKTEKIRLSPQESMKLEKTMTENQVALQQMGKDKVHKVG